MSKNVVKITLTNGSVKINEFLTVENTRNYCKYLTSGFSKHDDSRASIEVTLTSGAYYFWCLNTGWVDENNLHDHKCVVQETPDGMGCVTCLYT